MLKSQQYEDNEIQDARKPLSQYYVDKSADRQLKQYLSRMKKNKSHTKSNSK